MPTFAFLLLSLRDLSVRLGVDSGDGQQLVPVEPLSMQKVAWWYRGSFLFSELVDDLSNFVHLFSKMTSLVSLVQACLSFDCEDWLDVLAELYKVPALVADSWFAGFVGFTLLASFVVAPDELRVRGLQRLLWSLLGEFAFRVVGEVLRLVLERTKVAAAHPH